MTLTRPKALLLAVAAVTAMFAFACGSDAASEPTPTPSPTPIPETPTPHIDYHPIPGEPFKLDQGDIAILNGDGASVRFERIVSDNRCPLNVTCITGGAAVVEMVVRLSSSAAEQALLWSIGPDSVEPSKRTVAGLEIELLEVEPVPGGGSADDVPRVELVVTTAPN